MALEVSNTPPLTPEPCRTLYPSVVQVYHVVSPRLNECTLTEKSCSYLASLCVCVCVHVCSPTHLSDEHTGGHGETGARGEVAGDHDAHAGLGEGQLVGVGRQQLVHHQHRGLPVEVSWKEDHTHRSERQRDMESNSQR